MEMISLEYELHPTPGMPLAARKAELDTARFVSVRNLAYLVYKKPDGTPLMTYHETLDARTEVKNRILVHEINCTYQGQPLVVNDGTSLTPESTIPQPPTQPEVPQQVPMSNGNGAPNGVPMMAPQYAVPSAPASAAQAAAAPNMQPPPGYQPQPQMAPPQGQPIQQESAPTPGKRTRRNAGAAVAPPPPAPPPAQAQAGYGAPAVPPMAAPGYGAPPQPPIQQSWQPPAAPTGYPAPAPSPQAFAPPQAFAAPPAPSAPPATYGTSGYAQQVPSASVDLTPVLQKVDNLGRGLEVVSKNGDEALKAIGILTSQLQAVQAIALQSLTALHHVYLSLQGVPGGQAILATATEGKANDLASFQAYLSKYIPPR